MKFICIIFFVSIICSVFGQEKVAKSKQISVDTLVLLGGRKIPSAKISIGATIVTYALVAKPDSFIHVQKKEVEMVLYKNGNKEVLSKPPVQTVPEGDWQTVLVTKSKKDVAGMYKRGFFKANGAPSKNNADKARESAVIKLQRQAAAVKASIVLIVHEEKFGAPGDNPGYNLEAEAYGLEPLEEGTNVVVDKNKKTDNKKKK